VLFHPFYAFFCSQSMMLGRQPVFFQLTTSHAHLLLQGE
jgi:hypothetical protein